MEIKKDKHGRCWWFCAVTQTRTGHIAVKAKTKEEAEDRIRFMDYGSAQEHWDWPNVINDINYTYQHTNYKEEADNE